MRTRSLTAVLVLAVLLAGCSGVGPTNQSPEGSSPTPTDPATTTDETPSPTQETSTATESATTTESPTETASGTPTATPTVSPTPTWIAPVPPNKPKEGKYDDDNRTRLYDVEIVNRSESGDGYSNFDVEVDADTRMPDIDPPEYGDVEGEPYFLIYANEELIYRSDYVAQKNGTFTLNVHPGSLTQFEEGTLDLTLFLMDRDSEYDDEYGIWTGEIEYAPE